MSGYAVPNDMEAYLRPVMVKDLRVQLRARGLSPAGSRECMVERLREAMIESGDYTMKSPDRNVDHAQTMNLIRALTPDAVDPVHKNNYSRPEGQNVGNFLTDRNTSRVLAPPGGETQVSFGYTDTPVKKPAAPAPAPAALASPAAPVAVQQDAVQQQSQPGRKPGQVSAGQVDPVNNYSRPGGMQNVGNFLTDRNTSRVLAPPGGNSSVTFG